MSTKEELHQIVDRLSDEDALELLDQARWLLEPTDRLTPEEMAAVLEGKAEIARGEWGDGEELLKSLGH